MSKKKSDSSEKVASVQALCPKRSDSIAVNPRVFMDSYLTALKQTDKFTPIQQEMALDCLAGTFLAYYEKKSSKGKKWLDLQARIQRFSPDDQKKLHWAYFCSKFGHLGKFRDDGKTPYFEHPKSAAFAAIDHGLTDVITLIDILIHDTPEESMLLDTELIYIIFGLDVMGDVSLLTKKEGIDYIGGIVNFGTWRTAMAKVADRWDNIRTLGNCTPEKRWKQIKETRFDYKPIYEKLVNDVPLEYRRTADWFISETFRMVDECEADLRTNHPEVFEEKTM